jgi:uncharacterized Rossmann fold enzyme
MTLRIVCVNWQNYCGRGFEYVEKLHDMVRRNLPDGLEGSFECFSDRPFADPLIFQRELPPGLEGWFNKLYLFSPGLWPEGDRIVYFDLDTLITGRLDEFVAYDGEFAILRNLLDPQGSPFGEWQSAVMMWRSGFGHHIWENYVAAGHPRVGGGDQAWIEAQAERCDIIQHLFPGLVVSYKGTGGRLPGKASIVCFHGKPRPHEVKGWAAEVWKVGGFTRADLDKVCNTEMAALCSNVRMSTKRELPWLDTEPAHEGHAVIVGGGPSIKERVKEIKQRVALGQKVFALNGTADWLRKNGILPDYHVIADARAANRDFILSPSFHTEHLIASQCHPCVLDKLFLHKTTLWHANVAEFQPIIEAANKQDKPIHLFGGGSTVGLNAMTLAFGMGYRKIHLYGMDSSYNEEGAHHAYVQAINDDDLVIDVMCADRKFKAAPWMAQQANEFERLAIELMGDGCIITVHSGGLIDALARDMVAVPRMNPAEVRAFEVLKRLDSENPVGAEVGVFAADMSQVLLREKQDLFLYMVDSWEANGAAYAAISGDWHAKLKQDEQARFHDIAVDRTAFAADRREIVRARSVDAVNRLNGTKLDFVFIDADHSYEGCRQDLEAWSPKVKSGGWVCGHDYANPSFPLFGVKRAVDEFVAAKGLSLELGENLTYFIRIP